MKKKKRWTYKDRRPWWKPKPSNPEKRVRLLPHEIIVGPRELSVVWDDGRRFRRVAQRLFSAFKRTRGKESRRMLWEVILEGEYSWHTKIAKRMFSTLEQRKKTADWRKKWQSKKLKALFRLRKTSYGFLPASESISTIPT